MKRQILGLDISDDFVAAAVVQQTGQERKILSCGFLELRSRKDLGEVLPALLQQVSWGGGTCICGISLDRISLRNLNVPFTDRKKLSQVLPLELEDQFLVPAGEQVIDYMTTASTKNGTSLLVAGIEKEQLRSDIDAMLNGGVKPLCVTLRNLALAEKLIESNSVSGDFILLDLGACSMNILFVHDSRVVFIRRLACPERMFTQAPFSFQNGLANVTHPEETTACITTLCNDIHRSIGFYRLDSQADFQPQTVVLSGSLANIAECQEVIRTELELDVVTSNLQESARVGLDDDVREQWRPAVLDHSLALALRGTRKRSSIDFRKDEFAADRYLFASKTQLAAAAAVAVLLLGSALVLLGFDYSSLKNRHDRMGAQMAELYRDTFPGATKIIDPLVQMQANVRDVQAPSIATPVFSGEKRALNILADISARISESIVLQVSRMVIDQESVQIKGLTDTFNNVNLIQGSLQRSPNFNDVAIVSAAADKETGMIRFELRLQAGGGIMIKISRRDRNFLAAGAVIVLLFIVFQFGISPLMDGRDRLRKGIGSREKALVEMKELQVRYRELHGKANSLIGQLNTRASGFSLFSFLEQMAAKSEVKKNIAYMKPSETADDGPFKEVLVEMKLQTITLKQLVDFLELVESPQNIVALKRISIQENKKEKGTLDVIMQVVSLNLNPNGQNG